MAKCGRKAVLVGGLLAYSLLAFITRWRPVSERSPITAR
jgi:hypothetical protein